MGLTQDKDWIALIALFPLLFGDGRAGEGSTTKLNS